MARTLPDKPVGGVKPEVARVFRTLKQLPDDWTVWHHLTPWEPDAPDFMVLDDRGCALLVQVSGATPRQARQSPQLQMLELEVANPTPGEAEELRLSAFLAQVCKKGVPSVAVTGAVIFPNLAPRDLRTVQQFAATPQFRWLGKDWIANEEPESWATLFSRTPLDEKALHILRQQFTPEVVIPVSFVARVQHPRRIDAELGDYLLDYDQEYVLKTDLDLDAEGERLSRDFRIQVVNGVTGSGKTLILLYRLRLLHAMFPTKLFLVLTHNRPLIRDIRARFRILSPDNSRQIDWHTFMGWCRKNWPKARPFNPISKRKRDALVRRTWTECLAESSISERMFKSELDWAKDSGIVTREEYLGADRRGRGFRLTQSQREQTFATIQAYQKCLISAGEMDWWDVPRRMWHWIEEGRVEPPRYNVVMVDEAQFFAPVWFDIVRHLVEPGMGHLFVAADPTQGFLRQGESWKTMTGLEVRGRSYHLRRSYRTTQAILTCALAFYRQRVPEDEDEDEEDLLLPDWAGMRRGKPPLLLRLDSPQDERARIVNEVAQAVGQGVPLRHILVLLYSARGEDALREALNKRLGENASRDPKDSLPGDFVRVTTMNAGTGLESPIVFVAGIHEMFEEEGSLHLGKDERAALVQSNTRKLYMAFTRAGQRLILTYVGDLSPSLKELAQWDLLEVE